MKLVFVNHKFSYEIEKVCRLFFPFEKIGENADGEKVVTAVFDKGDSVLLKVEAFCISKEQTLPKSEPDFYKEQERILACLVYDILCEKTGIKSQWGILTGIRPTKLLRQKQELLGKEGARIFFTEKLKCSENKFDLLEKALKKETEIIAKSKDKWYSLYFSVPFCPSRCSYCSFVSHSIEKTFHLLDEYVDLLCKELKKTAKIAKDLNLHLATVYFGGGTPTTLSANQLEKVLDTVCTEFDIENALEFNVEAGRPDTVTAEKLKVLKAHAVSRISINPQTLNDEVLKIIGRNHTAKQMTDAFYLARGEGFDNINTDLIAGLPGDSVKSFENSLNSVLDLSPESITVHSLAMKKASNLSEQNYQSDVQRTKDADEMLSFLNEKLKCEYNPYYLYRQAKSVGNLENVGYCKEGKEGLYNIYIMDETHTILACGGGATTKLKAKGDNVSDQKIKRIYNYKYPYEYISSFDEMMKRKEQIYEFYDENCNNRGKY